MLDPISVKLNENCAIPEEKEIYSFTLYHSLTLLLKNQHLVFVKEFKYLGHMINRHNKQLSDIILVRS